MPAAMNAKIDVAVNIFAKPWQTALSLLSLLDKSGRHINALWLQYEPMGSRFDKISPYLPAQYLQERGVDCRIFQPVAWLGRSAPTSGMLRDSEKRMGIRYENAWENTAADYLFLMHNDVYIFNDILRYLMDNIGDAFAAGQLGQCWNCPASRGELTRKIMGRSACTPQTYAAFKPGADELEKLYAMALERGMLRREYDVTSPQSEFKIRPWPLPECRINEWACLINMRLARPLTLPKGDAFPPGAYRNAGPELLDIVTPWFRDLHAKGLTAKHCDLNKYMKHWVGTGNKSAARYAFSEDRARDILAKKYPDYIEWVVKRTNNR